MQDKLIIISTDYLFVVIICFVYMLACHGKHVWVNNLRSLGTFSTICGTHSTGLQEKILSNYMTSCFAHNRNKL